LNAQAESSLDVQTYHENQITGTYRRRHSSSGTLEEHGHGKEILGQLHLAVHHRGRNAYGLECYMKFAAGTACLVLMVGYLSGVFVSREQIYTYDRENVLGTSFEFKAIAVSEKEANQAMTAALAEIDREAKILSSYDPSSEFCGWVRTVDQPMRVSPVFYEVLNLWDQWRQRTNGVLDAAAANVIQVWKTGGTRGAVIGQRANVGGRTLGGGLGFGLLGTIAAQSSRNVGAALGYYGLAWSVFSTVVARGPEVHFDKNAVIDIGLNSRAIKPESGTTAK
jgi:hypothetical protein